MSRNLDLSVGEFYHVYNRGVERRTIFIDKNDYERFSVLLYVCNSTSQIHASDHKEQGLTLRDLFSIKRECTLVDVGAWCLMPNHFHLLLKEKAPGGISLFMQKLTTAYTMYFNKKHSRKGSLFEGTFKAKHLGREEYLKYQYTYIHLNPIGIIDTGWKNKEVADRSVARDFLKKYTYSSYKDYVNEERQEKLILNRSEFPEYFSLSTDFEEMVDEWINFSELELSQG